MPVRSFRVEALVDCEMLILQCEELVALHIGEDWNAISSVAVPVKCKSLYQSGIYTFLVANRHDLALAFADLHAGNGLDREIITT